MFINTSIVIFDVGTTAGYIGTDASVVCAATGEAVWETRRVNPGMGRPCNGSPPMQNKYHAYERPLKLPWVI